jgi:hypothetical protein
VYGYRQTSGGVPDDAVQVIAAYLGQVMPSVLAIQNAGVDHYEIEVEQLGSVSNFATAPQTGLIGTQPGSFQPPFVAAPFTLQRTTKETRNGRKRYVGLTEEVVTGDGWLASFETTLQALADALEAGLTTPGFTHELVIIGRRYDRTVDPPELLPVSQWFYNPVSAVSFDARATTQNTRKIGRGE